MYVCTAKRNVPRWRSRTRRTRGRARGRAPSTPGARASPRRRARASSRTSWALQVVAVSATPCKGRWTGDVQRLVPHKRGGPKVDAKRQRGRCDVDPVREAEIHMHEAGVRVAWARRPSGQDGVTYAGVLDVHQSEASYARETRRCVRYVDRRTSNVER